MSWPYNRYTRPAPRLTVGETVVLTTDFQGLSAGSMHCVTDMIYGKSKQHQAISVPWGWYQSVGLELHGGVDVLLDDAVWVSLALLEPSGDAEP